MKISRLFLNVALSVVTLAVVSPRVMADTIFLDMNFSYEEVAAAKSATKGNLIVIPAMSDQDRRTAYGFREQIETAKSKSNFAEVNVITGKLRDFLLAKGTMTKDQDEIDFEGALDQTLGQMESHSQTLDSIVFSGHHGAHAFDGAIGGVDEQDLHDIFTKHLNLAKTLSSVYLWGCYTLDPSHAKFWKKLRDAAFPSLNVLAGFPYEGPTQETNFDMEYLTAVMSQGQQATSIADAEKIITDIRDRHNRDAAFVRFDHDIYVSTSQSGIIQGQMLSTAIECDPNGKADFETGSQYSYPMFEKYLSALEPGYEDVPAQTGETNPLRKAYDVGLHVIVCYESDNIDPIPPPGANATPEQKNAWDAQVHDQMMSRMISDQMLGLIFYKQLAQSFEQAGKPELTAARTILRGIGESNLLPDNFADPSLTRHQIMAASQALLSFMTSDPKFKALSQQDKKALNAVALPFNCFAQAQFMDYTLNMIEDSDTQSLRHGMGFGMSFNIGVQ